MKKMMKLAFVAVIAAVAGYNVYQSQSVMNGMSDFALANVEALSYSEWDPSNGWACFKFYWDDVMSETFFIINRCSDCYTISVTSVSGSDYCWH